MLSLGPRMKRALQFSSFISSRKQEKCYSLSLSIRSSGNKQERRKRHVREFGSSSKGLGSPTLSLSRLYESRQESRIMSASRCIHEKCKVEGCDKQAQGTHDGMCKRHWKTANIPPEEQAKAESTEQLPDPDSSSVYDTIVPQSITFRPFIVDGEQAKEGTSFREINRSLDGYSEPPEGARLMPLVQFLRDGRLNKEAGWHRHEERRARGLPALPKLKVQMEPWERQLALVEILLLSGGTPYANFKDLAYAWGRERNFHMVLTNTVCERRGETQRKKRSDTGKILTDEQKEIHRSKRPRKESGTRSEDDAPSAAGAGTD